MCLRPRPQAPPCEPQVAAIFAVRIMLINSFFYDPTVLYNNWTHSRSSMAHQANLDELFGAPTKGAAKKGAPAAPKPAAARPAAAKPAAAKPGAVKPGWSPAAPKPPTALEERTRAEALAAMEEAEKLITRPRFALFWEPAFRKAATEMEKAATKLQASPFLIVVVVVLSHLSTHALNPFTHSAFSTSVRPRLPCPYPFVPLTTWRLSFCRCAASTQTPSSASCAPPNATPRRATTTR